MIYFIMCPFKVISMGRNTENPEKHCFSLSSSFIPLWNFVVVMGLFVCLNWAWYVAPPSILLTTSCLEVPNVVVKNTCHHTQFTKSNFLLILSEFFFYLKMLSFVPSISHSSLSPTGARMTDPNHYGQLTYGLTAHQWFVHTLNYSKVKCTQMLEET